MIGITTWLRVETQKFKLKINQTGYCGSIRLNNYINSNRFKSVKSFDQTNTGKVWTNKVSLIII